VNRLGGGIVARSSEGQRAVAVDACGQLNASRRKRGVEAAGRVNVAGTGNVADGQRGRRSSRRFEDQRFALERVRAAVGQIG
jgi:hypothetical protein